MTENLIQAHSIDDGASMLRALREDQPAEVTETEEVLADSSDVAETDEVTADDIDDTGDIDDSQELELTADDLEDDQAEVEVAEVEADPIRTITTVNGTEQLKQSEVDAGYMRQQDYTKKTMEVAEARKTVEAQTERVSQQEQQLKQALEHWAVPVEQEPDWGAASQQGYTPQQIFQAQQEWTNRQKKKTEAISAHQALQQNEQLKQTTATQETQAKALQDLKSERPELVDPVKMKAFGERLTKGANTHFGITPEQIGALMDAKSLLILDDAVKYRELKAGKAGVAKRVANAPTKLAPGAKPQKSDSAKAERQKAMKRLQSSGSAADGLALMRLRRQ